MLRVERTAPAYNRRENPATREKSPHGGNRNTGFLQVLLEAAERTMTNEDKTGNLRGNSLCTVPRGGGYDRDADGDIVSVFSGNAPCDHHREA